MAASSRAAFARAAGGPPGAPRCARSLKSSKPVGIGERRAGGVDQRHVHGRAAVVLRAGDRATVATLGPRHVALVGHERPEPLLHGERPVAVPDEQPEAVGAQAALDARESLGGVAAEQAARDGIHRDAGEVAGGGVAHVDADGRIDGRDVHQLVSGRARGVSRARGQQRDRAEEPPRSASPRRA